MKTGQLPHYCLTGKNNFHCEVLDGPFFSPSLLASTNTNKNSAPRADATFSVFENTRTPFGPERGKTKERQKSQNSYGIDSLKVI